MRTITRTKVIAASIAGLIIWLQRHGNRPAASGNAFRAQSVEMTVMFGADGAAGVTARYLADGMAKLLNVPVPVVNRTGGGGTIGHNHVKRPRRTAIRSL